MAPEGAEMESHGHLETQFHLQSASTILLVLVEENHQFVPGELGVNLGFALSMCKGL